MGRCGPLNASLLAQGDCERSEGPGRRGPRTWCDLEDSSPLLPATSEAPGFLGAQRLQLLTPPW